MYQVKHYLDKKNQDIFLKWYRKLRDTKTRIAIDRRIYRVEMGNFGDCKPCREGVWELRIDSGPGYRVYYACVEKTVVLLLCGGVKSSQEQDIGKACEYFKDWQTRSDKMEGE